MYKLCNYFINIETYLLLWEAACPRLNRPDCSFPSTTPVLRSMALADRGIRTPTSVANPSTRTACVQPLHQPQQRPLPRIPEERLAIGRELHPQQRAPLRLVFAPVPRRHRDQQRAPRLEAPRQRG